ncbi:transcription termination/antitermination protein NusA [Candidatus Poribacteria bacterium]|nr:transcription termination/antitermination protein NusA [Candidatus Poribacteria bacterium]MYG06621.1 transcription termination/antitermination protein NusA [Candidatus Poribacteria bacterium]MYK22353.1 transcription termination/antitermination protein NusA [Candidatus Poribacteria bacterium]
MLENLQNAIRQNTAQTDLPEEVFVEAIEEALRAAARRVYGPEADVSVEINLEKGDIRCYVPKTVVNIMRDFSTEIPIEEAIKLQEDVELGQTLNVEINPNEFGRIPAQLAKQILFQKIKQAERERVYQEFVGREGEVITGYVQRFERGGIILDLEQTEAFLPPREIPRSQNYERGKRLQCLILSVKNEARGAPVIVSRTHRDLVAVLFEQEVPEIYEGQVRIMAIARDPGNRAKVAVQATEEGIDAVGTCVGVKGTRVQNIISELDGEKIDLVEWSDDISAFIANALGRRAGVRRVELDDENKSAHVVVPDDKLSLAIGQRGQNARLAARLTGWKVDIKGESEATVSINELFKPEEPETVEAAELILDSPEKRVDENSEEQTADTPDPTAVEDVEVDTAEVEASETPDTPDTEESLLTSSEENIETLDVTAENDDLDTESE